MPTFAPLLKHNNFSIFFESSTFRVPKPDQLPIEWGGTSIFKNLNYNSILLIPQNTTYSNYSYVSGLSGLIFKQGLLKQAKSKKFFLKKSFITTFFMFKVLNSLNKYTTLKIESLRFSNLFFKNHVGLAIKKFKKYATFFGGLPRLVEFVSIIFITMISKDIEFFRCWFIQKFESMYYRRHKKFLYLIKLFICNYMSVYLSLFKCSGFFLKVRGKIGVGGNSKKRRYSIRIGECSLTSKSLKFNIYRGNIRTLVGVLGISLSIFYV